MNGEAIFGTRPWNRAASEAVDASGQVHQVRFTQEGSLLFATVFDTPAPGPLRIRAAETGLPARARLLGGHGAVCAEEGPDLVVEFPPVEPAWAHCLELAF